MKGLWLATACTVAVLAGGARPPQAATGPAGSKPGCGTSVQPLPAYPASFTVDAALAEDPPPVPEAYDLASDTGEAYEAGRTRTGQVMIVIYDCNYDLVIDLTSSATRTIPTSLQFGGGAFETVLVNVDRVGTIPVATAGPTGPSGQFAAFCADSRPRGDYVTDADGLVRDNYAGCAQDPNGRWYVRRAGVLMLEGPDGSRWLAMFNHPPTDRGQPTCGNTSQPGWCGDTTFVRVYHPDANTWILAPESADGAGSWPTAVWEPGPKSTENWTFVGYDSLPFRITVHR